MRLSVVVLTRDERADVLRCIEHLERGRPEGTMEIIVVDNGSTDGTGDAIAAAHPEVRLVRSPRNLGVARGRNLGMRHARGALIGVADSDAFVRPGALESLCLALEGRPDAAWSRRGSSTRTAASSSRAAGCRRWPRWSQVAPPDGGMAGAPRRGAGTSWRTSRTIAPWRWSTSSAR